MIQLEGFLDDLTSVASAATAASTLVGLIPGAGQVATAIKTASQVTTAVANATAPKPGQWSSRVLDRANQMVQTAAKEAAKCMYPATAYHVRLPNGRYDIYGPPGTTRLSGGLGNVEVLSSSPFDILTGNTCLYGDCGLAGDVVIASNVVDPCGTRPRPVYKNPIVKTIAIVAGVAAVAGVGYAVLRRR